MSEHAQQQQPDRVGGGSNRRGAEGDPDVLLDIPKVAVDSVRLTVNGLDADVSLRARVANLLQLDVGVRVHLEGADLDLAGVHAEALLKVRLENMVEILDRALSTIDRNPEVIQALSHGATAPPDDVNRKVPPVSNLPGRPAGPVPGRAGRVQGPAASAQGPAAPVERSGGATDDLGQQVGAIGAVADESLNKPAGSGPGRSPGVEQGAEPGAGPGTKSGAEPGRRGGGLASGSGGGGEQGQAQRAREQMEHALAGRAGTEPGAGRRETGGSAAEQEPRRGAPEPGGQRPDGEPGGQREGSAALAEGGADRQDGASGGESGPDLLAEQAAETLRRAGRSVWEAIQSGVTQYRQERR